MQELKKEKQLKKEKPEKKETKGDISFSAAHISAANPAFKPFFGPA